MGDVMRQEVEKLSELREEVKKMGGEAAVKKHHDRGKLTARERLAPENLVVPAERGAQGVRVLSRRCVRPEVEGNVYRSTVFHGAAGRFCCHVWLTLATSVERCIA